MWEWGASLGECFPRIPDLAVYRSWCTHVRDSPSRLFWLSGATASARAKGREPRHWRRRAHGCHTGASYSAWCCMLQVRLHFVRILSLKPPFIGRWSCDHRMGMTRPIKVCRTHHRATHFSALLCGLMPRVRSFWNHHHSQMDYR